MSCISQTRKAWLEHTVLDLRCNCAVSPYHIVSCLDKYELSHADCVPAGVWQLCWGG